MNQNEFFQRRLNEINHNINKYKRRRKLIKIIYSFIIILSILTSTISASLANVEKIPHLVITSLSMLSAILTGLSTRFNFTHKKNELDNLIKKSTQMQIKIDKIISFNESPETTKKIIEELTTISCL